MSDKKLSYNFLLIGKTGSGKSSTGNTLLNRKSFETSDGFGSCSSSVELKNFEFIRYKINVVDTPGIHDTNKTFTETLSIIHEGMSRLPAGFDAILLVVKFGEKLTQEMIDTIDAAKTSFGDIFTKQYCIIVFTFGDSFGNVNNNNIVQWCKDEKKVPDGCIMQTLLKECDYKVVLFYNNKEEKREESVEKLLSYLHPQAPRYTNEIFKKCADIRDEYVTRMGFPEQRAKIQRDLSLLQNALEDALNQNDENPTLDDINKRAEKLLKTANDASAGTDKMNDLIKNVEDILERIKNITEDKESRKKEMKSILEKVNLMKTSGIALKVFSAGTLSGLVIFGTVVVAASIPVTGAIIGAGILGTVGAATLSVASYAIYRNVSKLTEKLKTLSSKPLLGSTEIEKSKEKSE